MTSPRESGNGSAETAKFTRRDLVSHEPVRWCPGCGDYAILAQMQKVMPELGIPRENIVFVSGIGCSSRFPYYMDTYGFHTIHGRAPAIATGLKVARPDLSVWVVTGDGDALSIGGNHLIHALRRNVDLKILLFNNEVYGLTKGQFSPTSPRGMVTKSSPMGTVAEGFSPLALALGAGATFVARTVDTDTHHLQEMIRRMASHKGASLLEILQNCPVLNDGIFDRLKDRKVKADELLVLEDGQPLSYGVQGDRVLRLNTDRFELRPELAGEANGSLDLVHDEKAPLPTIANLLARCGPPDTPVPIGVLRAVDRPSFETSLRAQESQQREELGGGSLEELLYGGDVWEVS